ncbi:MAG TPA: hypothetical protein VEL07_09700 [Planctomycetota bacterium]|nr:hypothetical protein [Planctomycetota bacterium]
MHHRLLRIATVSALVAAATAAVHDVGPGQTYTTIASVPALAPGDEVRIHSGTYHEVRRWRDVGTAANPIIIRGVGPTRPVIDATGLNTSGSLPHPRAAFQIEGSYITVERLEFRNAANASDNGAGVRIATFTTTVLGTVLRDCLITGNQMGIMSGQCDDTLIESCEIAYNGSDQYAHNCYLGGGATRVVGCWIHHAIQGQNFKTRGHYTELLYNRIEASSDGEVGLVDAAETDAPHSNALMVGNVIISAARGPSQNQGKFINFGQDVGGHHHGTLYAYNNTFIAADPRIRFFTCQTADASLVASGNVFVGSANIVEGAWGTVAGARNWMANGAIIPAGFTGTVLGADPGFVDLAGRDARLTSGSPCREIAPTGLTYADGAGVTRAALATREYREHLATSARVDSGAPDAGAYGFDAGGGTSGTGTTTGTGTATGTGTTTGTATTGTSGTGTTGTGTTGGTGSSGDGNGGCGRGGGVALGLALFTALMLTRSRR